MPAGCVPLLELRACQQCETREKTASVCNRKGHKTHSVDELGRPHIGSSRNLPELQPVTREGKIR